MASRWQSRSVGWRWQQQAQRSLRPPRTPGPKYSAESRPSWETWWPRPPCSSPFSRYLALRRTSEVGERRWGVCLRHAARDPPRDQRHAPLGEAEVQLLTTPQPNHTLTKDQSAALSLALNGVSMFIGGEAGTGKSHVIRCIVDRLRAIRIVDASDELGRRRRRGAAASAQRRTRPLRVAVTASTGIAALNIGGNTFHSVFGAYGRGSGVRSPLGREEDVQESPKRASFRAAANSSPSTAASLAPQLAASAFPLSVEALGHYDVIVIDEVSLLPADCLDAVDVVARTLPGRSPALPFGGIQMILSGDFMQLMAGNAREDELVYPYRGDERPGGLNATRGDTARGAPRSRRAASRLCGPSLSGTERRPLFENEVFRAALLHLELREPIRQRGDPTFIDELNQLRRGRLSRRLLFSAAVNPPTENAVHVFATRSEARAFNESKLAGLRGRSHHFRCHFVDLQHRRGAASGRSAVKEAPETTSSLPTLCPQRSAVTESDQISRHHLSRLRYVMHSRPHLLRSEPAMQSQFLKVGCRVLLLVNLSSALVNGSIGTVLSFSPLSSVAHLIPKECRKMLPPMVQAALRSAQKACGSARQRQHTPNRSPVVVPVVQFDGHSAPTAVPWVALPVPLLLLSAALSPSLGGGTRLLLSSDAQLPALALRYRVVAMPLVPAYAFTVHKLQGITLSAPSVSLVFDCKRYFPCPHLLYVAASRVKRYSQLRLLNVSPQMVCLHRGALEFSEKGLQSPRVALKWWRSRGAASPHRRAPRGAVALRSRCAAAWWVSLKRPQRRSAAVAKTRSVGRWAAGRGG